MINGYDEIVDPNVSVNVNAMKSEHCNCNSDGVEAIKPGIQSSDSLAVGAFLNLVPPHSAAIL